MYSDNATDYEAREYWIEDVLDALQHSEIGGGAAYVAQNDVPQKEDCDRTITSASDLQSACEADEQLTVWIDEPIDMGSHNAIEIQNITIAGDYGQTDSPQSLIYSNATGRDRDYVFHCHDNVRMTGIRARGATHDYWDNENYPGYVPLVDGRYSKGSQFATLRSDSVEIENCEIWGWGTQAFGVGASSIYCEPEIHHSYIHDNMITSYGYAFTVYRGHVHCHHNLLDAHRHDVNGFGHHDVGYLVEYNVFGPSASSHRIDMHSLSHNDSGESSDEDAERYNHRGGGDCTIRYNTFLNTNVIHGPEMPSHDKGFDRGRWSWVYSNRGVPHPGTTVEIHNNRLMHPGPQSENLGKDGDVRDRSELTAFIQNTGQHSGSTSQGGFARVEHHDNQYDCVNTPYEEDYGAPIDLENPNQDDDDPNGARPIQFLRNLIPNLRELIRQFNRS